MSYPARAEGLVNMIASGRSSGLHPLSSHSCWMYVRAGHPAFARPYVGIHRSTSGHNNSSYLFILLSLPTYFFLFLSLPFPSFLSFNLFFSHISFLPLFICFYLFFYPSLSLSYFFLSFIFFLYTSLSSFLPFLSLCLSLSLFVF